MTHKKFPGSRTKHAHEPQMAREPQVEYPWSRSNIVHYNRKCDILFENVSFRSKRQYFIEKVASLKIPNID